jgi:hypothetical protein
MNDDICSICIDKLVKLVDDIKTTDCNHKFHKVCLDTWLNYNNSCPYCRNKIESNITESNITKFIINMNQREAGYINYINQYYYQNINFNLF